MLSRYISSLLSEVKPADALTFVGFSAPSCRGRATRVAPAIVAGGVSPPVRRSSGLLEERALACRPVRLFVQRVEGGSRPRRRCKALAGDLDVSVRG